MINSTVSPSLNFVMFLSGRVDNLFSFSKFLSTAGIFNSLLSLLSMCNLALRYWQVAFMGVMRLKSLLSLNALLTVLPLKKSQFLIFLLE